jgi:hypothetical protein
MIGKLWKGLFEQPMNSAIVSSTLQGLDKKKYSRLFFNNFSLHLHSPLLSWNRQLRAPSGKHPKFPQPLALNANT